MEGRVFLVVLLSIQYCFCLPVNRGQVREKRPSPTAADLPGLYVKEYMNYLEEAAKNDPSLMERMKKVKDLDLNKLAEMLARNPHLQERMMESRPDVRNPVEEAKRITVEQMRQLQKLQSMRDNKLLKDGDWMTQREAARENLPPQFNNDDIRNKLQEAKQKLEALDRQRKENFKQEEMWQEHRRRQKLVEMNEQQRLKAEDDFKKKHEQLRHHDKLPQPASKDQLEQVWEEDDGMTKQQFNPRTFFHMHDTNADMTLDALELEALFYTELKKVYKDDIDGLEAKEDMARMREYAVEQIDTDKDGLVSMDEFLKFTKDAKFDSKEEWHPIVDEDSPFSDKEFQDYEEEYDEDYDYQYDDEGNIIGIVPKKKTGEKGQPPQQGQPPQHQGQPPQHQGQPPQHQDQPPQHQGQPPQHQGQGQPPQHQGQPPQQQGQPPQGQAQQQQGQAPPPPQQGQAPPPPPPQQGQAPPPPPQQGQAPPPPQQGQEIPKGAQVDDPSAVHVEAAQRMAPPLANNQNQNQV